MKLKKKIAVTTIAPAHRYKCRRVLGTRHMWRLMEYRELVPKRKGKYDYRSRWREPKYGWLCIAIGTKALNDVAVRLNLLP